MTTKDDYRSVAKRIKREMDAGKCGTWRSSAETGKETGHETDHGRPCPTRGERTHREKASANGRERAAPLMITAGVGAPDAPS